MTLLSLTPTLARRLAITRQRLSGPQSEATPDGIMALMRDIGCIQIDPIRAVERTQFLVLWSRLGQYDVAHLDTLLWQERKLFEYWAHAASIVLTEDYPLHQIRMRRFAQNDTKWARRIRAWMDDNKSFRQYILEQLGREGPLFPKQIEDLSTRPWTSTGWTNARNTNRMIEFMWEQGDIMVATRKGLRKKWDLTEKCLPEWTPRQTLSDHELVHCAAQKSLRALGVGTAKHINNHFIRDRYPNLETVLSQLVAEERVLPLSIQENGPAWSGQWYIHADDLPLLTQLTTGQAWQPRTTLLSPFDNLICDRTRTEQLWDFHFRIEIYVPKAKRKYGYYVLPILHGDRLIGRIDPKMERKTGKLHINALYLEPNAPQDPTTKQAISQAITELAQFLQAQEIVYNEAVVQELGVKR